jgi:ankyrin repeat protein
MWEAAINGQLPLVECLVGLGQDVNERKDAVDPDDPDCSFCQVEGPIVQAAGEGHVELVRWLLEHGARINYTVNGKVRCLALLRAATNGHLEVVKLLIASGAAIRASFNGHTPLSQAVAYGHAAVADYLRSVGAEGR